MIGTLLGNRYELLEVIGEGGMAVVYKAKCHLLDRFVAVKILKDEFSNDKDFVIKFKMEATAAASLSHNNIVNIYDVGTEKNINYIVMEYVKGRTLKKIIKENIRLSSSRTIDIASQIASALECAHKNSLIHRDIKPHNILVTEDGLVKVTDFGIAKGSNSVTITNSSKILGSAHYFSPEQAKGGYVDLRSDLYSLGIVMYEMITGKVPYDAESPVSVALKHIQEPVIPPKQVIWDVPESLNRVILKAIEKEPIKRYQSARELLNDLDKIKRNENFEVKFNNLDDDATRVMAPVVINKQTNSEEEEEEEEVAETNSRDKKGLKKGAKIALFISALLLVVIVGVVVGNYWASKGTNKQSTNQPPQKTVTFPQIVGKSQNDAKTAVEALGLQFVVVENDVSDQPAGTVLDSNYKEGDSVPVGSQVRVKLSSGKEQVDVPDVRNVPQSNAKDMITNNGLVLGKVTQQNSDTVPQGSIISQNPSPDTTPKVDKGTSVDIVVSLGPAVVNVPVPPLNGLNYKDVGAVLQASGLVLGDVTPTPTNIKDDDGKVAVSYPVANTTVQKGSKVNITYWQYTPESNQQ